MGGYESYDAHYLKFPSVKLNCSDGAQAAGLLLDRGQTMSALERLFFSQVLLFESHETHQSTLTIMFSATGVT